MNSQNPTGPHSQAYLNKAKATSIKYRKYRQHLSIKAPFIKQCMDGTISKIDGALTRVWNLLLPKCIRGPCTPYQALRDCVSKASIKQLQNITLSKGRVQQAVQNNRMSLLITYSQSTVGETLSKLHNNQQINALINKKAAIFLIKQDKRSQQQMTDIQAKVYQFLSAVQQNTRNQQRVVVVWKGLFQEILILSYFMLSDQQLYSKIMVSIQEREDYQQLVVKLATQGQQQQINSNQNQDKIFEHGSFNKLAQQTTAVDKQDTNEG